MPSHITHNQLYLDVYKNLPEQMKREFKDTWEKYKIFGQGHDLLFFYMFLHIHKFPTLLKQLQIIEDKDVQQLTINYVNYLIENNPTHESKLFLYGYLMHHFLDAKLHPLIIYETGDFLNNKESQANHLLLENMLDAYMLKKNLIDPKKFKIYSLVPSRAALTRDTREMISYSFKKTYEFENFDKVFAEYNKNTETFMWLLRHDPKGIKQFLFKPLDYVLKKAIKPSVLPFHFDGTEAEEYLNKQKEMWTHPIDTNNTSIKSYDELYEEGVSEIAKMVSLLNAAILDKATDKELATIVPDVSSIHGYKVEGSYNIENTKKI